MKTSKLVSQLTAATSLLTAVLVAPGLLAQSFSDDFSSGSDANYTHYDPISGVTGVPWGTWTVTGGEYHLHGNATPNPAVGGARVGGIIKSFTRGDFAAAFDLMNWDNTQPQFIGLGARFVDLGLGTTDGYLMGYDNNGKAITIVRIGNEGIAKVVATQSITLDPAKDYHFAFSATGGNFTASVAEAPTPGTILANIAGSDTTIASGQFGLIIADVSGAAGKTADATFDNFSVAPVPEPQTFALIAGLGLGGFAGLRRWLAGKRA